jgi:hypothetical protein
VDALLYARRPGVEGVRVAADIDFERLWALLMALRADPEVDRILLDRGIQGRLRAFGRDAVGAPAPLLDALFSGRGAWVRHAPGHRTHLHVRFKATASAEAALLVDALRGVERVRHRVGRGETLETLARRYAVPVAELAAENRLPVNARLRRGQRLFVLVPRPAAPQFNARASLRLRRCDRVTLGSCFPGRAQSQPGRSYIDHCHRTRGSRGDRTRLDLGVHLRTRASGRLRRRELQGRLGQRPGDGFACFKRRGERAD